jgi:hypothetical protein
MSSVSPVLIQANQFQLGGYDTVIDYSTTSVAGVPQLTYKTRSQTLNFRGEQIRTERTSLGQMVTVVLRGDPQAVGAVESLTLLVPTVNVSEESKESPVQTVAILSLRSAPIKVPGQSPSYMMLYLSGTASQLDF